LAWLQSRTPFQSRVELSKHPGSRTSWSSPNSKALVQMEHLLYYSKTKLLQNQTIIQKKGTPLPLPRRSRVGDPGGRNLAAVPHYRSPPPSSRRRRGGLHVGEAPDDAGGAAISPSQRSCGGRGRHGSSWSSPSATSSTAAAGARAHRSGI
jgi:hypothetical protein